MQTSTIQDNHRLARHCPQSKLDDNKDMPTSAAFMPRKKDGVIEDHLSVNWLEYFGDLETRHALQRIRDTKRDRVLGGCGKLGVLTVGTTVATVQKETGIELVAAHRTKSDDPSHSSLEGYDVISDAKHLKMAGAILLGLKSEDVHPIASLD